VIDLEVTGHVLGRLEPEQALAGEKANGGRQWSGRNLDSPVIRDGSQRRRVCIRAEASQQGEAMIVVRFKVQCQPSRTEDVAAAMEKVVRAARSLPGVIQFDVGRDLTDSNALIATEVFEDGEAMQREESLPEVARVIDLMQGGALAGPPEWTRFEVASAESPSM
jgi:quinol monooxygenase YgiN